MQRKLTNFHDINDMARHAKENQLSLFVYKKAVYDMTEFIEKHPGGEWEIKQFEQQNINDIIFNIKYHKHQPNIIATLQFYLYGYIEVQEQPIFQMKSSQLIVEKTRKFLQQSTFLKEEEEEQEIPEDVSIEEIPISKTNRKFYSQKSLK